MTITEPVLHGLALAGIGSDAIALMLSDGLVSVLIHGTEAEQEHFLDLLDVATGRVHPDRRLPYRTVG